MVTAPPGPTTTDRRVAALPVLFGLFHMFVDATTIFVLARSRVVHALPPHAAFGIVMAYDLAAFASQPLLGMLADSIRVFRGTVLAGLALAAMGVALLRVDPWLAVLVGAAGNAAFHVGAGALCLHAQPGRATPAGIFVAPGALGVAAGKLLAGNAAAEWPFLAALAAAALLAAVVRVPHVPPPARRAFLAVRRPVAVLLLLLFSIVVRSLVGRAGGHLCPHAFAIAAGFACAAFGGKALGGIVSDRFGWLETGVGALLLSAPLVAFGGSHAAVVTVGLFLVQMTMPVTLAATVALLPGRPGTAFGLAALAYIGGFMATFLPGVKASYGPWSFLALILLAAAALYAALRLLGEAIPMKFDGK